MPQVPYTPYPTAEPQGGSERVSVQTPGAAFGENIGTALTNLGSTTQKVGDELFNRAIAMQNLANENDARVAQSDFAEQSSQLYDKIGALSGKAASDALSDNLRQQRELRENIGARLTSPMARKYYDADSLPFMQRNMFAAGHHAAEQNKAYTLDTYDASLKMSIQNAAAHPDDANYVAQQRAEVRQKAQDYAELKFGVSDPNDPNVQLYVNNALSAQRTEQILAKSITDSITAGQWAKTYAADLTNPADKDRVLKTIENRGAVVAASQVATGVLQKHIQPDGTYDVTATQLEQETRNEAGKALPDNELVADTAAGKLHSLMFNRGYFQKQDENEAKFAFNKMIAENDVQDAQTFMAMPNADNVIAKLPPNLRTAPQLQKYITNFQASVNKQTNEYWATTINGMKSSDSAQFMSVEPTDPKYHLNKQDIIRIQNEQAHMAQNPQDDPRVSRAMGWLLGARGAELGELKVDQKHPGYEDDFYHFRGALQEAIQIEQEKHPGQQPTYEDIIDKIGPQIIKTEFSKPGRYYGTNTGPAFMEYNRPNYEDIPVDQREKIISEFQKKGVAAPTERELTQIYARQLFNQFFRQSSKPSE